MDNNPWSEWWQDATFQWQMLSSTVILRQLTVLAGVMLLALVLDRLLERQRRHFLGEPPHERAVWSILWATKYPLLVLLIGHLALSIYRASGRPAYTLGKLVDLFWFIAAFALLVKAVSIWMPASEARRMTRRVLLPLLAIVGLLHLVGLLPVLWTWASQPVVTLASEQITLTSILLALFIAVGFWFAARVGKAAFLKVVLPRTQADPSLAGSVAGFVQFSLVILGLWLALSTLGVEFTNLTLLLSALTVGLGFGLQDVIKNVVGGVILLGEGHVKPGEIFQIAGETGTVERIGIRSTTVRTLDRAEVIIPNSYLISEKVIGLTGWQRVEIQVGVSCDADPRQVERLLLELTRAHPGVLDTPAPSVFFANLGESTFDFSLYCFVEQRSDVWRTKSDLRHAIVERFRQEGIEMPYPQRDLHLRSGPWSQVLPQAE